MYWTVPLIPYGNSVLSVRRLNILRVLCGSLWVIGRTVLLQLYHTLIYSKFDYGSFIYISAWKSKLSILDTIQNVGIQLVTALNLSHTSLPVVFLYDNFSESPPLLPYLLTHSLTPWFRIFF